MKTLPLPPPRSDVSDDEIIHIRRVEMYDPTNDKTKIRLDVLFDDGEQLGADAFIDAEADAYRALIEAVRKKLNG